MKQYKDSELNNKNTQRWDILNNLPRGAITQIANDLKIPLSLVSSVLYGKRKDKYGIIKAAELIAAINIWKTQFCKLDKSKL